MSVAITEEMLSQLDPAVQAVLRQQLAAGAGGPSLYPEKIENPTVPTLETLVCAAIKGTVKRSGFLADIDYDGVNDAEDSYSLLPTDVDFEGQLIKVEEGTSSGGHMELALQIKILLPAPYAGRRVFDRIYPRHTGDFPRKKTKSFFRACGMLHEAPGECWITCQDPQDLMNEAVRFRVKNEEYNERVTPKVAGLYAAIQDFSGVEG